MAEMDEDKKIAIFIDAENTTYDKIPAILQEIAVHGRIITKRAYGDFSSANLKRWKDVLNENAIDPVQQFSYSKGKNSSDSAMIIDAMDLLYTGKYDTFVLISSDSDFTKLATRLKNSQKFVFGVGKKQTPVSFVKACDDFIYIENLKDVAESEKTSTVRRKKAHPQANGAQAAKAGEKNGDVMTDEQFNRIYTLLMTAHERCAGDDGWAFVSAAGSLFKRLNPGFDTRDYGYRKLTDLIASLNDDFEMKGATDSPSSAKMYRPINKD